MPDQDRRPYAGDGADGARRSAEIDRAEAETYDRDDDRRAAALASAQRWEEQAARLEQRVAALEAEEQPERRGLLALSDQPRPGFAGPWGEHTERDGRYLLTFSVPFRDDDRRGRDLAGPTKDPDTGEHPEARPALEHAGRRIVASAVSHVGHEDTVRSWTGHAASPDLAVVEVRISARSDRHAAVVARRVAIAEGADYYLVSYCQPTEDGWRGVPVFDSRRKR